jgi:hypothetical protein
VTGRADLYEKNVVAAADRVVNEAIGAFVAAAGKQRGFVVTAPAGAGKSGLVCRAVGAARAARLRVAVASPTNEQAFGLVDRLAQENPQHTISFFPASTVTLPAAIENRRNVDIVDAGGASTAGVVVATVAKLGDAFGRGNLLGFDAMLVDESYQANSTGYYAIGHLASTHLLVGDSGQLSPFSTIPNADQWRGLDEDPLQTAVGVLLRNHPRTSLFKLPITRRLDPRAVPVVRAFYPANPFEAAVQSGVRQLRLFARGKRRPLDPVLDLAARHGWAHLELPDALTLSADPEIVDTIVELVRRLGERRAEVRCERRPTWASPRIAVGVSHNDQKDQLRAALDNAGRGDVVVDTANKLQGLEYDVVVAWHPLSGLPEADEFHLDAGRLCVLLTRHRHACILVGRAGDRTLLEGVPPKSPSYIGSDQEPFLDGWAVHEEVFAALEPFRIAG